MVPSLKLNDGSSIPFIAYGAGTAILRMKHGSSEELDRATIDIIKKAIHAGYRHLDTADIYNNTAEVGVAIRESFAEGVIKKREELYITTKVAENFANIAEQLEKGLQLLGVDYVDLHLIHAPYWTNSDTDLQKAWAGMEAIKASGKARSIGVSNYEPRHLKATLATARIPPSINQIEFHPYFAWREGRDYLSSLREDNVAVSAYGALTPLTRNIPGPLDEKIQVLAKKYNVNPELICLRWCIDQDVVVVTTTRHEERMKEYFQVFDFKLTKEEVATISNAGKECVKGEELTPRVIQYYQHLAENESSAH